MASASKGTVRVLLLALLVLVPALAGCSDDDDLPQPPTRDDPDDPDVPRLAFGGRVVDAATGEILADAQVRLDLAQVRPCKRPGIIWNSYDLPVAGNGTFGPFSIARPKSDDVAFFLHVGAPGHASNVTFIGPDEARRGTRNLTVVLHPQAAIEGRAPPGTLVALDHPGFPRFAVANETGVFRFDNARVFESAYVVATDPPVLGRAAAPATLDFDAPNASAPAWRLEGVVKAPDGRNVAADVVAWNGSVPASAGRSGPNGVFVLPLAAQRQDLLLEARTSDGQLGGVLRVLVEGPPSLRHNVLTSARC